MAGPINIEAHGALGNGTFNDRSAFSAAATVLSTLGGGEIFVPSGTWTFKNTWSVNKDNNNIRICGTGPNSVIKAASDFSSPGAVVEIQAKNVTIENVKIDLSALSGLSVALGCLSGTQNLTLRNVYFYKGGTKLSINNGLNGNNVENVTVVNCTFDNGGEASGYGILLDKIAKGRGLKVEGCNFIGDAADYIEVNLANYRDITIVGNSFSDLTNTVDTAGFAIGLAKANSVTIANNTFNRIFKESVHIEDGSFSISVTGNTFRQCGKNDDGTYEHRVINCINSSTDINISDNTIVNTGRKGIGIYLGAGGGINGKRYTVNNNIVRGMNMAIKNDEQFLCSYQGNNITDCVTAILISKAGSQTFISNVITQCDYGFKNVNWSTYLTAYDSKQVFIGNIVGTDVSAPFEHDEAQPLRIGRIMLANQGIITRTWPLAVGTTVAELRDELNAVIDRLRGNAFM